MGDFLEFFLCSGVVRILIRVVFQGTSLVGLLELLLSSSWGNPQGIVELGFLDHVGGVVFCCVVEGFQVVVGEKREELVPGKKGLSRVSDGGAAREVARVASLFLSGQKSGKWRARVIAATTTTMEAFDRSDEALGL